MERILILNGPNLNFLGIREPEIYGTATYEDLCKTVTAWAEDLGFEAVCVQSNHEGVLIDELQKAHFEGFSGCVLNAGGYTHTSVALRDAVASVDFPVVEVHLSDPEKRERFRRNDCLTEVCAAMFKGEGFISYRNALVFLADLQKNA